MNSNMQEQILGFSKGFFFFFWFCFCFCFLLFFFGGGVFCFCFVLFSEEGGGLSQNALIYPILAKFSNKEGVGDFDLQNPPSGSANDMIGVTKMS
jgi:hypothetical protein